MGPARNAGRRKTGRDGICVTHCRKNCLKPSLKDNGDRPPARFRLWFVLLVPALFLAYVMAPVAFQAARERHRRNQATENMRQIGEALEKYRPAMKKMQAEDAVDASLDGPTDESAEFVDGKTLEDK